MDRTAEENGTRFEAIREPPCGTAGGVRFGTEVTKNGGGDSRGMDRPGDGGWRRTLRIGGFTPELAEREARLRATLSGPCELHGRRWFPVGAPRKTVAAHLREERRRLRKNRRQRERNRQRREADAAEARVAALPPDLQARLYGRTPTSTRVNGRMRKVDYMATVKSLLGPHDAPIVPNGVKEFLAGAGDVVARLAETASAVGGRDTKARADPPGYVPPDVERTRRMGMERRKANRRATVAACPTPTDIRVGWDMRRAWAGGMIRLGALLLDLECYVDNSIVRREVEDPRDPDGPPRLEIVARRSGLRGWIAENCPELAGSYKTLMRYKSMAAKLRQALDIVDPVPLSAVFDPEADARRLRSAPVHEQPRQCPERDAGSRLPWEPLAWEQDANGRCFRRNRRYCGPYLPRMPRPVRLDALLEEARTALDRLLGATSADDARVLVVRANGTWNMSVVASRVAAALVRREAWWAGEPSALGGSTGN